MTQTRNPELLSFLKQHGLYAASASDETLFKRRAHTSRLNCGIRPGSHPCVLSPDSEPALYLDSDGKIKSNLCSSSIEGITSCLDCPIFRQKTHQSGVSINPELSQNYPYLTECLTRRGSLPDQRPIETAACALIIGQAVNRCQNGIVIINKITENGQIHSTVEKFNRPTAPNCSLCQNYQKFFK